MTDDDITTKPGFIKRSRKAIVAFVTGTAGSIGPAIAVVTADGVVNFAAEVVPVLVVGLGIGLTAGFAVWATSNAS